MAYVNISVMVLLGLFQAFDHGAEVEQTEKSLNLAPGDHFNWYCGQYDGMAMVVSYADEKLKFKKIH
jgi:hypothetical protein